VAESRSGYMADYRKRHPGRDRFWNQTRRAALERLKDEYPERFAEILTELRRQRREESHSG
jgi:hypothetical protein